MIDDTSGRVIVGTPGSAAGGFYGGGGWGGAGGSSTFTPEQLSERGQLLEDGKNIIEGDRDLDYGPPLDNFKRIAGQLTALGYTAPGGGDILAHDVAVIQIVTKTARIVHMPAKRDNWLDVTGYAGCGWQCVIEGEDE